MSILFAVTHPNRITALILAESFAKSRVADYPEGNDPFVVDDLARMVDEEWGSGASLQFFAPALVDHPKARRAVGTWERMAGSPSAVLATLQMIREIDLRPLLPSVQVPTLVLQRRGGPRPRLLRGGATWLITSPVPATWSKKETPIFCGSATPTPSSLRSRSS